MRLSTTFFTAKMLWRCWRISREYGIPFAAVVDHHAAILDATRRAMEQAVHEVEVAEIAKWN
jgi:hypothetical protein